MLVLDECDTRVLSNDFSNDLDRIIGAGIVSENKLLVWIALIEESGDASVEIFGMVVVGRDNADERGRLMPHILLC